MSTSDFGGRLASLGRQVGTGIAGEMPNLERRIDMAERLVDQHSVEIAQYRHEAYSRSALLERRLGGMERLVVFLAEVLIALIAAVAAALVAGYLGGDYWFPSSGLAAFAFLVVFLGANFLFRKVAVSCLD